jgi:hypothetical protein
MQFPADKVKPISHDVQNLELVHVKHPAIKLSQVLHYIDPLKYVKVLHPPVGLAGLAMTFKSYVPNVVTGIAKSKYPLFAA